MMMLLTAFALVITDSEAGHSRQDETKRKAIEQALGSFSGTWEVISTQPPGVTKDAKVLVFHKDQTYSALDKNGKELWAGAFDLDPTTKPKVWDHRSNEAQQKGGDTLASMNSMGTNSKSAASSAHGRTSNGWANPVLPSSSCQMLMWCWNFNG